MEQYHPWFSNLFVSVAKRKKQVSQNNILFRRRLVISYSDGSASDEDCRSVRGKAVKVRKIVISLLFRRNLCIPASTEGGDVVVVVSEHFLSLLPLRYHPQAYGYIFQKPCGGGSRGQVAHYLF